MQKITYICDICGCEAIISLAVASITTTDLITRKELCQKCYNNLLSIFDNKSIFSIKEEEKQTYKQEYKAVFDTDEEEKCNRAEAIKKLDEAAALSRKSPKTEPDADEMLKDFISGKNIPSFDE